MASYGKQNYRLDRQIKSKKAINDLYYVLDSGYTYTAIAKLPSKCWTVHCEF